MGEVGAHQMSDVLPQVSERLSPFFLGDHVVALCVPTPMFDQSVTPVLCLSRACWQHYLRHPVHISLSDACIRGQLHSFLDSLY